MAWHSPAYVTVALKSRVSCQCKHVSQSVRRRVCVDVSRENENISFMIGENIGVSVHRREMGKGRPRGHSGHGRKAAARPATTVAEKKVDQEPGGIRRPFTFSLLCRLWMLSHPLTDPCMRALRGIRGYGEISPSPNESEKKKCNGFSFVIIKRRRCGRNRREKSVTDTDSGMQQEHSRRKSMFSSSDGGEEGGEGREGRAATADFPLRFSVSELALRSSVRRTIWEGQK